MRRGLLASIVVSVLALGASPVALAAPTPEALALGKSEFDRGVALLEDARYADAAAALERSVAAFESPSALYNLGLAYRGRGAYKRAIATLERFLVIASSQHEQLRTGAQRILPELVAGLATVALEVQGGAEVVTLDGEALAMARPGASTFSVELVLDPGVHELVVSRRGFAPVREALAPLQAGERRRVVVEAARDRLQAELVVDTDVEAAIVRVDGAVGGAGGAKVQLAPGPHTIEVAADGWEPASRTITLDAGARERVTIGLVKSSGSVLGAWWFWVGVTAVVGAAVVGGVVLGRPEDPSYDGGTFGVTLQN